MAGGGEEQLGYVLEHQPNIYCYQLFVTLPSTPLTPRVSLEVVQQSAESSYCAQRSSTGAVLHVSWTAVAQEHGTEAPPPPPSLSFTLNCPGVTKESLVAGIEAAGEYLHVKVQPPPIPIDAHRLVSLEQQSRERSKLPKPRLLETVHCRACSAPLHRGCAAHDKGAVVEDITHKLSGMQVLADAPAEEAGCSGASERLGQERGDAVGGADAAEEGGGSEITAVHELPSENWLDMADLWVCGCCGGGGTRSRFKHFALEEIKAKPATGLLSYSGNYLMLHASYFAATMPLGPVQGGTAWKPLQCYACNTTLGVADRIAGEEDDASYKLFFHCISSGSCAGEDNWFERFSVESKLAQMVYELAKSRHCFRICAYVAGEREPFLLASVLHEALANELVPVVKLLYAVPEERAFKALSDSWCIMGKGKERLDLLPGEARDLRRLLEANAGAWPPAMRNAFPGQQLSFLCLDSRPELPRL